MRTITRSFAAILLPSLLLASCYPKQKILVRFPDGTPKVVRYFKRGDTLHEKLVSYYDNGKREYIKYWRNDLPIKTKETLWYKNGRKQEVTWEKLKDTIRKYIAKDSVTIITGFFKRYKKAWYESGKPKYEDYIKNGHEVFDQYNEQGIMVQEQVMQAVRPDGYDTLVLKIYKFGAMANK